MDPPVPYGGAHFPPSLHTQAKSTCYQLKGPVRLVDKNVMLLHLDPFITTSKVQFLSTGFQVVSISSN